MSSEEVLVQKSGPVYWLTLNRPAQANAINSETANAAIAVLREAAVNAHVIVITGAGKHFCGGADLKAAQAQREAGDPNPTARLCAALSTVEIPVIAAINGAAIGGGCEIALTCDFRFISFAASIALPEIRFGLLPAAGGTQRLPRLIGAAMAKRLVMTGASMNAEQAFQCGFAETLSQPESLREDVQTFASELSARPRYALVAAKHLVQASLELPLTEGLKLESEVVGSMGTAEERAMEKERASREVGPYQKLFK